MGKSISQIDLGMLGDNTGDNISEKNKHYCELTGLYWAWKNLKNAEIVGMVHYRRYFDFHNNIKSNTDVQVFTIKMFEKLDFSVPQHILKRVLQGSIVLAKPHAYGCSLYDSFCQQHNSYDLKLLQKIIMDIQPKKYFDAFMHVMYLNNKLSPYNMFLMNKQDMDEYCEWLFPLLQEVELRVDLNSYGPYYGRLLGFLSERLLNVWCYAEKKDIQYYPIMMISDSEIIKNHGGLKMIAESILKWSIVKLTNIKYRHMYKIE